MNKPRIAEIMDWTRVDLGVTWALIVNDKIVQRDTPSGVNPSPALKQAYKAARK